MRIALALAVLTFASQAEAEQACPKYGSCVPLDTFKCESITGGGCVNKLCYEPAKHYAIVWLGKNNTPYHYCDISQDAIDAWRTAPSACGFYNAKIRSKPDGTHGPYDCRDHAVPQFK